MGPPVDVRNTLSSRGFDLTAVEKFSLMTLAFVRDLSSYSFAFAPAGCPASAGSLLSMIRYFILAIQVYGSSADV